MQPTERTDLQNRVTAAILMADIDITSGTRAQATDDQYRAIADRIIDKVVGPERLRAAAFAIKDPDVSHERVPAPSSLADECPLHAACACGWVQRECAPAEVGFAAHISEATS